MHPARAGALVLALGSLARVEVDGPTADWPEGDSGVPADEDASRGWAAARWRGWTVSLTGAAPVRPEPPLLLVAVGLSLGFASLSTSSPARWSIHRAFTPLLSPRLFFFRPAGGSPIRCSRQISASSSQVISLEKRT